MSATPATSVVIAVKGRPRNLGRILSALASPQEHGAELIFAVAGDIPPQLAGLPDGARIIVAPPETLVPCLWRDGICAASARRVALMTSECVPTRDWLAHAAAADVDRWAGIGGVLVNDSASDARNWAVYLLRYARFAPPARRAVVDDIAADNAVYDRDAILQHQDLLEDGFWEPSFHARFHAGGRELLLDPQLVVTHCGTNEAGAFMRHRFAHGREYGESRAARAGRGRSFALLLASPLLPGLMLCRILARAAKRGLLLPLLRSAPFLLLFVFAWAAGEASGYLSAVLGRSKNEQQD